MYTQRNESELDNEFVVFLSARGTRGTVCSSPKLLGDGRLYLVIPCDACARGAANAQVAYPCILSGYSDAETNRLGKRVVQTASVLCVVNVALRFLVVVFILLEREPVGYVIFDLIITTLFSGENAPVATRRG